MDASRQTWPIAKPYLCLMATVGRLDLPGLPDRPYHPEPKVIFPKHALGVTMLASLWPRYQVYRLYFPLKLRQHIARDPVTSCAEPVFFNWTTCEVMALALLWERNSKKKKFCHFVRQRRNYMYMYHKGLVIATCTCSCVNRMCRLHKFQLDSVFNLALLYIQLV